MNSTSTCKSATPPNNITLITINSNTSTNSISRFHRCRECRQRKRSATMALCDDREITRSPSNLTFHTDFKSALHFLYLFFQAFIEHTTTSAEMKSLQQLVNNRHETCASSSLYPLYVNNCKVKSAIWIAIKIFLHDIDGVSISMKCLQRWYACNPVTDTLSTRIRFSITLIRLSGNQVNWNQGRS